VATICDGIFLEGHNRFDNPEMAEKARAMLRSAAEIDFVALPQTVTPGQTVVVDVVARNVGAGHKLPTGFPEGREMWVDFKVHDATGREIYRLGAVEAGHTERGTHSLKQPWVMPMAMWWILPFGMRIGSYLTPASCPRARR